MKKFIIGLFLASASLVSVTSCDMDLVQPGTETPDNVGLTISDLNKQLTYLYTQMRGITSGSYVTNTELQMDQFNGVEGNGYRGGQFALGEIYGSNSGITSAYNACYGVMANINFFFEKAAKIKENGTIGEAQIAEVEHMEAQAKFIRAYFYFYLMDHFALTYNAENVDKPNSGVAIVTEYNNSPSFNRETYIGRSTINEVFSKVIDPSLDEALDQFLAESNGSLFTCEPNANYINACTVLALQARIALYKGDYQTAMAKAQQVISNTNYRICSIQNFKTMWTLDESSELIFVPFVNQAEYAYVGSMNEAWNNYQAYPTFSDYIPSGLTLDDYDNNDVRKSTFFTLGNVQVSGSRYQVYQFTKFPGNDQIWGGAGTNYYKNKPKPFRLSEQYLILAEAANALGLDTDANNALKALRSNRLTGYTHVDMTGEELRDEIRAERRKELIGEGFRMSDLRRWGLGFERDGVYTQNPAFENQLILAGLAVTYVEGDYRYVWPIPTSEIDVNPQMKQNPGYEGRK